MSTGRNKPDTPAAPKTREATAANRAGWPLWGRVLASIAITWHLLVVFISPLSVPPSSTLVQSIAQSPAVRWYSDPLFLNQGYHFFAPDPGPGHLIEYTLLDATGQQIETGRFPSKRDQWPRLRYHRYMMLADQIDVPGTDELRAARANYILMRFAWQLLREHPDAASVRVSRLRHNLTRRDDYLAGRKLDDPMSFVTEYEVAQSRAAVVEADKPKPSPAADTAAPMEVITPGVQQ